MLAQIELPILILLNGQNHVEQQLSRLKSTSENFFSDTVNVFRPSLVRRWGWIHNHTDGKLGHRGRRIESGRHPYRHTFFNRKWRNRLPQLVIYQ